MCCDDDRRSTDSDLWSISGSKPPWRGAVRMHRGATWRNRAAAWRPEHEPMHNILCIAFSLMLSSAEAGRPARRCGRWKRRRASSTRLSERMRAKWCAALRARPQTPQAARTHGLRVERAVTIAVAIDDEQRDRRMGAREREGGCTRGRDEQRPPNAPLGRADRAAGRVARSGAIRRRPRSEERAIAISPIAEVAISTLRVSR